MADMNDLARAVGRVEAKMDMALDDLNTIKSRCLINEDRLCSLEGTRSKFLGIFGLITTGTAAAWAALKHKLFRGES